MKKISVLLLLLICCICDINAQENDVPDMITEEMLYYESVYNNQVIKLHRSSLDNPLTLRSQLQGLFDNLPEFTDAYVCIGSQFDISDNYYKKADDVLDADPILLAFNVDKDKEMVRKFYEPNVAIYLGYNIPDGTKRYLICHMRVRGLLSGRLYARMTFMYQGASNDDGLTYQSQSVPYTGSYITVFDATDPAKDLECYESTKKSMTSKIKEKQRLDTKELEVYRGIYEIDEAAFDNGYSNWLFNDERYLDAFNFYEIAYFYNRSGMMNGNKDEADTFYEACRQMGRCLAKTGINDKAFYYMSLAEYGDSSIDKESDKLAKLPWTDFDRNSYQSFDGKSLDLNRISVGQMLNTVFDVLPDFIEDGRIMKAGDKKSVALTADKAWNIDLKSLCLDKPSCITLRYTKAGYETKDSTNKSKLLSDNVIIITVNHISNTSSLWRVNILIPNFRLSDSKREDKKINMPRFCSFIIGNESRKWNMNSPDEIIQQCESLNKEKRSAESLAALKYVFSQYAGKKLDNNEYGSFDMCASNLVYALNELNCNDKAYYYHYQNIQNGDANEFLPYVNNLISLSDPRTEDTIDSLIKKIDEAMKVDASNAEGYRKIKNNLLRRKGYVLIEKGRLDEAETLLTTLLGVTDNPSFIKNVKGELEYIKRLRSSQE